MARLQTFWIQMWKNKPLDKSRRSCRIPRTKMAFYSKESKCSLLALSRLAPFCWFVFSWLCYTLYREFCRESKCSLL
ncbi:hypothetical protein Hanom_Chr08g00746861 [Helianthus anomalus]